MDGLFHGKPYLLMDDLGVPLFLETPILFNSPFHFFSIKKSTLEMMMKKCGWLGKKRMYSQAHVTEVIIQVC